MFDWDYTSSVKNCTSTTTVADKHMGKVVGEPYRGKPDVRFEEGDEGIEESKALSCTGALLYLIISAFCKVSFIAVMCVILGLCFFNHHSSSVDY